MFLTGLALSLIILPYDGDLEMADIKPTKATVVTFVPIWNC